MTVKGRMGGGAEFVTQEFVAGMGRALKLPKE